jgi:hypothetical protein
MSCLKNPGLKECMMPWPTLHRIYRKMFLIYLVLALKFLSSVTSYGKYRITHFGKI